MSAEAQFELAAKLAAEPATLTRAETMPAPPAPRRKTYVSRRTYEGMQPRKPKVPTTAEDSLALRAAELKRRRKDERRAHALRVQCPIVNAPASVEVDAATLEPMAPCAFVVIEPSGDA